MDNDFRHLRLELDGRGVMTVWFDVQGVPINIFNDKVLLASPQTATDDDYARIESVVAHEYFHNWTGDRVTCRDWFQLSLKEGLTVFRDQEYMADQFSAGRNSFRKFGASRRPVRWQSRQKISATSFASSASSRVRNSNSSSISRASAMLSVRLIFANNQSLKRRKS